MTKPLTDAEMKAEILDLSPEILLACVKRVSDFHQLLELQSLVDRKTATLPVYCTGADYRLERFDELMNDEYGEDYPKLTEDEVYDACLPITQNYDIPDSVYEDVTDQIDDALRDLHKKKFPEWWAKQESDDD